MPGFVRVLTSVADLWRNQRDRVDGAGRQLSERLRAVSATPDGGEPATAASAAAAAERLVANWDRHEGGFGYAPKFPQAMVLDFLLAHALRTGDETALEAATHSLTAMARGGIYDHVGGGFARYATDRRWLVPHFEKMLYDNALLLRTYTHAFQVTGDPRYRRVVEETVAWLLDDMAHDAGGFASALDADSEGQEGKFYVWSYDDVVAALQDVGVDPVIWTARLGVTRRGNVNDPHGHIPPGTSVLHEAEPVPDDEDALVERAAVRAHLTLLRSDRVAPDRDGKVLVSWNALTLGALATAGAAFSQPGWISAAERTAQFIADTMVAENGRLWHRWTTGHGPGIPAFAEDVAFLAQALIDLYEAGHDRRWLAWATVLAADADARFRDQADGTYFTTADDGERLIARPREVLDNATPSASSVMVDVHLRLAGLTGDQRHLDQATRTITALAGSAVTMPSAFGALLTAIERWLAPSTEVAVVGPASEQRDALVAVYRRRWRPRAVLAVGSPDDADPVPLLRDRTLRDGQATAYVCRHFVCELPVTSPDALAAQLAGTGDDEPVD